MMKWKKNQAIMSRPEGENQWCLYNPKTSSIHLIKSLLYMIWLSIDEEHDIDNITKLVMHKYEIPNYTHENWQNLILLALKELEKRQLIEAIEA